MCALEFRCRFEKAMTTPSLGITIFGGAKERESDRIPLRHFPSTRIIRTIYRRGYRSDRRRGVSLVHQFKRMDRIHIGSPFPRPPSLSYFILFFFVAVYLLPVSSVCNFQRVAKGKRKKKKSNTSALMAVRVSRQRTKKEKPPCRFGRPTVSQPRHDIVDLIGQTVSERHLYIIF